jgi:DNA-binding NtrC family response regulator
MGIKILLVDDEPDYLLVMSQWFQAKGYAITVARNGEEALRKIKEENPNVVFLDVIMPHVDGMSVLTQVRKTYPLLSVILMSAHVKYSGMDEIMRFSGISKVFYKSDDFLKALEMVQAELDAVKPGR